MEILFIIFGVVSLVYGIMTVAGRTKDDLSKDSEFDKRLFSKESRYGVHRYYGGFKAIIAGLGAIALGVIMWIASNHV